MAHRAIGLDIGSSSLRAAQVSFKRTGVALDKIGEESFAQDAVVDGAVVDVEIVSAAIRRLWRAQRFTSKRVHLAVAGQRVIVREVTLPQMPAKDLALAIPYLVKNVLPMDVASAVLDFHPLEEVLDADGSAQVRGLLVAASQDMVMANVAAVKGAGLKVASIDLAPFAVLRSVGSRLGQAEGTEALVDIGANITSLVVHRESVPQFVRILQSGGADLTDAIVEALGIGAQEAERFKAEVGLQGAAVQGVSSFSAPGQALTAALVEGVNTFVAEIRTSLDYFSANHPGQGAERLVISGGTALLPGLAERMSQELHLPVSIGDPSLHLRGQRFSGDVARLACSPSSAVPVGLALGAAL